MDVECKHNHFNISFAYLFMSGTIFQRDAVVVAPLQFGWQYSFWQMKNTSPGFGVPVTLQHPELVYSLCFFLSFESVAVFVTLLQQCSFDIDMVSNICW